MSRLPLPLPLPLPLSDRVPVVVVAAVVVFQLHLEQGRTFDNALDRGHVHIVDDTKGLLPIHVPMLCCCMCVMIAIVIAIAGSRSGCCCCGVPVALGAKDVLAMFLIEDVSTLLMMLKDC